MKHKLNKAKKQVILTMSIKEYDTMRSALLDSALYLSGTFIPSCDVEEEADLIEMAERLHKEVLALHKLLPIEYIWNLQEGEV